MTAEPFVIINVEERIGWLTLNEPARLNPVGMGRLDEINAAAKELSARDDVRVVIVTGAGRGFCSGADLSRPVATDVKPRPGSGSVIDSGPGMWTMTAVRQPVIAMVNGPAVGYGVEMALQADFRFAARSAKFCFPFAKLGVVSDTGAGSWLLPRLIGWSRAAELLYTGRLIDADEAERIGLVNYVLDDADLREFTVAFAREIAQNSAFAVQTMKRMLFGGLDETKREHLVEQYFRFSERDPKFDGSAYSQRFRDKAMRGVLE